jgi:hypothetical protein
VSIWGSFRADLQSFLDDATVDGAIIPNRRELPRVAGVRYKAFCDPSGGRHDSFTLAIAHSERAAFGRPDRIVLDALRVVAPPFEPEAAVSGMAETLVDYGLREVHGDQYSGEWCPSMFRKYGVRYCASELSRREIYLESLPLFSQGLIELLDLPMLRTQLLLLERRTRAGSRADIVDHPRGAHDDLANSACGALHLAVRKPGIRIADSILLDDGDQGVRHI